MVVQAPAIELAGVSRRFGSFLALDNVNLSLATAQVHAFVGQNGAGKSTFLGLIAGRLSPTAGSVYVAGKPLPPDATPEIARRAGVSTIYQELSVVPALSAIDNVFLNDFGKVAGLVDYRAMRKRFDDLAGRLGVRIDPSARAGSLSIADQQMLEIMRALHSDCRVLLLDEPTAALSRREREALFSVVRDLRGKGVTILLVTHYLDEVEANADTVTVFRDGRLIDTGAAAEWTRGRMVSLMLGPHLESFQRDSQLLRGGARADAAPSVRKEVLRVEGLASRGGVSGVSLVLHAGEIVGLGGLVGSGRTALIRALAGSADGVSGRMLVDGRPVRLPRTPHQAMRLGIATVPEDRKSHGLFPAMSSRDNIGIGHLRDCSTGGFVRGRAYQARSDALARAFGVETRLVEQPARELSGGNQQKLLLARSARSGLRVLLADEATRGIDVGAKNLILKALRRMADEGAAVVFVSSDLEEVVAISDRVYVLRDGRIAGHLDGAEPITEAGILAHAFAVEGAAA